MGTGATLPCSREDPCRPCKYQCSCVAFSAVTTPAYLPEPIPPLPQHAPLRDTVAPRPPVRAPLSPYSPSHPPPPPPRASLPTCRPTNMPHHVARPRQLYHAQLPSAPRLLCSRPWPSFTPPPPPSPPSICVDGVPLRLMAHICNSGALSLCAHVSPRCLAHFGRHERDPAAACSCC